MEMNCVDFKGECEGMECRGVERSGVDNSGFE